MHICIYRYRIYLSIYLSICLSVCLSIDLSIYLSISHNASRHCLLSRATEVERGRKQINQFWTGHTLCNQTWQWNIRHLWMIFPARNVHLHGISRYHVWLPEGSQQTVFSHWVCIWACQGNGQEGMSSKCPSGTMVCLHVCARLCVCVRVKSWIDWFLGTSSPK